jgi:hypothetical protein
MTNKLSFLVAEDPEEDLRVAEVIAQDLEDYLVKDDLYRTIIVHTKAGDQNLQMTGGDLLTRLHRLQVVRDQLAPELQARVDAVTQSVQQTTYSLLSRFHDRLRREMKARLDSLKWFLDDCSAEPQRCRAEFPFEMRNRQRVEEILKELGGEVPPELSQRLQVTDQRIRTLTHGTSFIWDDRVQNAFPQQPYWYLYVSP